MEMRPPRLTTSLQTLPNQEPSTSNYLCFDRGVAGLGLLTDHGDKLHGWDKTDYEVSHNLGRGKILWDFRNHLLRNLKIDGLGKGGGGAKRRTDNEVAGAAHLLI